MTLATAKSIADFPHGVGRLRVLDEAQQCPKCERGVKLIVVPVAAPQDACCLACFGPTQPFPEEPTP